MRLILICLFVFHILFSFGQSNKSKTIKIEENEFWWGALTSIGSKMPFDSTTRYSVDLYGNNDGNQAQPLLLSSKGRYIWCESPFSFSFEKGEINIKSSRDSICFGRHGKTLPEVYNYVSNLFFRSNGVYPNELMFIKPQYNTWIELMYNQNEEDILQYAQSIIDNKMPPGVLMIDDNWQEDYGTWQFSSKRFKHPKEMIQRLHEMGFKVMLWVCPFVSPDSETFRYLSKQGLLLLDREKKQNVLWANTNKKAAMVRWWNGASSCLDLSNQKARDWFNSQLNQLVKEYGVDGFKLDAGDAHFYDNVYLKEGIIPNDQTTFFAQVGLKYDFNEYRAAWKMAGYPLVQRLSDKAHNWEDLRTLIPNILQQGIMGYAYTCPDMIGGGEYQSFLKASSIDQELIVRSTQVHAFMPMMQFSVAPWRVLDKEKLEICLKAVRLHEKYSPYIIQLAKESSKTSIPIVRSMEFVYPNCGYEKINDQFFLGNKILIAPATYKGQYMRDVILPKGKWKSDLGEIIKGGRTIHISVPLDRIPYFEKIK